MKRIAETSEISKIRINLKKKKRKKQHVKQMFSNQTNKKNAIFNLKQKKKRKQKQEIQLN